MATQLVKKKFGGKRKGYKGKKQSWYHPNQLLNPFAKGKNWLGLKGLDLLGYGVMIPGVWKDGGRVTKPKGVGKATRGYGKAMRKK